MGVGINSVTSCNVYSSRVIGTRRMRKKEAEEGGGRGGETCSWNLEGGERINIVSEE